MPQQVSRPEPEEEVKKPKGKLRLEDLPPEYQEKFHDLFSRAPARWGHEWNTDWGRGVLLLYLWNQWQAERKKPEKAEQLQLW